MAAEKLTYEEHLKKHEELHKSLDELVADFIYHHRDVTDVTGWSIAELMTWSLEQSVNPTGGPNEEGR